ncbi:hypothetical protein L596_012202 [Steinernema carpocapsae]|uniref:G-protein coupled receptors family 1 profile domain-containing protein n=1 Tax=Steinernema carpocapsae TaxID=34508 RepID=A0A4U5NWC2_STECR|nr:hypothetical protein L596_012202 [Steinernema carpocapsae]
MCPVLPEWLVALVAFLLTSKFFLMLASLPINVFIIFLSMTKIPYSFTRTYALNISSTMLISISYALILDLALPDKQSATSDAICDNPQYYNYVPAGFISILNPFVTQNLFSRSVASGLATICGILQLIAISSMAVFYVLALIEIIKQRQKLSFMSTSQNNYSDVLRCILIYCTPPSLFTLVSTPEVFCTAMVQFLPAPAIGNFCITTVTTTISLSFVRLFVTALTALFAFREYRTASVDLVKDIFCWCSRRTPMASNMVNSRTTQ